MESINKGNYKKLIMKQARESRTIRSAAVELLDCCNFFCPHCYVRDTYHRIIDADKLKSVLKELRDGGCIWLLLTGGEILLHPSFLDIYLYAHELGYKITLFTNGYLLTEEVIRQLSLHLPELMEITVYGGDAESFDAFVGVDGAFSAVDANIDKLIAAGIPLKLKCVIMEENKTDFEKISAYANSKSLEFRKDAFLLPTVTGDGQPLAKRIEESAAVQIDMEDKQYIEKVFHTDLKAVSDELYICDAGYNSIFIDAGLNMSICMMARHIGANILDSGLSLKELQQELIGIRESKRPLNENDACYQCRYRVVCRYCPGQFLLANGSEYEPIKWNCNYAKLLADNIGCAAEQK